MDVRGKISYVGQSGNDFITEVVGYTQVNIGDADYEDPEQKTGANDAAVKAKKLKTFCQKLAGLTTCSYVEATVSYTMNINSAAAYVD